MMAGAAGLSVVDVRSVSDAEALLAQLEQEEVRPRLRAAPVRVLCGVCALIGITCPPPQAGVISELDELLEQQTQMDIKMSSFKHMLYGRYPQHYNHTHTHTHHARTTTTIPAALTPATGSFDPVHSCIP